MTTNLWKDNYIYLYDFIGRYDQDFKLDYPNEHDYWDEFFKQNHIWDKDYNKINLDNITISKGLISDINLLLSLPDSDPLWDVNNLKDGIFSDILVRTIPEARAWITSVRDYMQEKLDNLKK